jgi:hypothetical protein
MYIHRLLMISFTWGYEVFSLSMTGCPTGAIVLVYNQIMKIRISDHSPISFGEQRSGPWVRPLRRRRTALLVNFSINLKREHLVDVEGKYIFYYSTGQYRFPPVVK